jgi:hypothetical protein
VAAAVGADGSVAAANAPGAAAGPRHALTAAMIPIHCAARTAVLGDELGSDLCAATTAADRAHARAPTEGGWLTLRGEGGPSQAFEFTTATFGVIVETARALPLAVADPPDGCAALAGGGNLTFEEFVDQRADPASHAAAEARARASAYRGRAVVVQRGGCSFIHKAKAVMAAGAAAILVVNSHTGLSRLGVEPRWKGLVIDVPVVMVTDVAGVALSLAAGAPVTFTLSKSVNTVVWDEIERSVCFCFR